MPLSGLCAPMIVKWVLGLFLLPFGITRYLSRGFGYLDVNCIKTFELSILRKNPKVILGIISVIYFFPFTFIFCCFYFLTIFGRKIVSFVSKYILHQHPETLPLSVKYLCWMAGSCCHIWCMEFFLNMMMVVGCCDVWCSMSTAHLTHLK